MPRTQGPAVLQGKSRYQGWDQPGLPGEGTLERRLTGQLCEEQDLRRGLVGPREQHPQEHETVEVVRGDVGIGRSRIQGPE